MAQKQPGALLKRIFLAATAAVMIAAAPATAATPLAQDLLWRGQRAELGVTVVVIEPGAATADALLNVLTADDVRAWLIVLLPNGDQLFPRPGLDTAEIQRKDDGARALREIADKYGVGGDQAHLRIALSISSIDKIVKAVYQQYGDYADYIYKMGYGRYLQDAPEVTEINYDLIINQIPENLLCEEARLAQSRLVLDKALKGVIPLLDRDRFRATPGALRVYTSSGGDLSLSDLRVLAAQLDWLRPDGGDQTIALFNPACPKQKRDVATPGVPPGEICAPEAVPSDVSDVLIPEFQCGESLDVVKLPPVASTSITSITPKGPTVSNPLALSPLYKYLQQPLSVGTATAPPAPPGPPAAAASASDAARDVAPAILSMRMTLTGPSAPPPDPAQANDLYGAAASVAAGPATAKIVHLAPADGARPPTETDAEQADASWRIGAEQAAVPGPHRLFLAVIPDQQCRPGDGYQVEVRLWGREAPSKRNSFVRFVGVFADCEKPEFQEITTFP